MTALILTDDLPAAERFGVWREMASKTWVPMEFRSDHAADFRVRMRCADLGAVQVSLVGSPHFEARRTPRLIRGSAPDLLKISMPLLGPGTVSQDERSARLAPRDFAVYDTRHPFRAGPLGGDGWCQALTLMFPRALLPLPDRQLREVTAVPMRAEEGVGAVTSQFLVQLAANIDHYRPAEAARLAATALEVLATRLAHELDSDAPVPPETHRRVLLTRVYAFIQEHLGDPELAPDTIAAAHHISTRYLHKLFQEEGVTVAAWIRTRRLEGSRRDLADPTQASRPVVAIAFHWGFSSAAHFGQAFKAAYGMPPQEYRQWSRRVGETVRAT